MEKDELFSRIIKFISNYPDIFLNYGVSLILIILLLLLLTLSLVTLFSSYIADTEQKKFSTAFIVTFFNTLVLLIIVLLFSIVPVFGTLVGLGLGFLFMYVIIKLIYKTSFRKALIVLVFYWFLKVVVILSFILFFFFRNFPFAEVKKLLLS